MVEWYVLGKGKTGRRGWTQGDKPAGQGEFLIGRGKPGKPQGAVFAVLELARPYYVVQVRP